MHAFLHQLRISLSLHFRNRMALIYGYLFPTIFLIAFWVLYRYDRVPLARHMGELLTVTALGGACFGLPTTMVSERERGVWRRYRLAPVRTGTLLASTIVARYVLLVLAGLLQVALAMLIGMPLPNHPLDLWIAFTFVAFALMGLGLVIATLADNVPAVQALGQCIFLPMLIIGGVAVQLTSLPEWAQHVSAFFPGRYAVEAMQTSVTGAGLGVMRFSLLALLLTGLAGFVAGIRMFRWDAQQRFVERGGKAWVALALAAWAAVGLLAEARGRIGPVAIIAEYTPPAQPDERLLPRASTPAAPEPEPAPPAPAATPGAASPPEDARPAASPEKTARRCRPGRRPTPPPENRRRQNRRRPLRRRQRRTQNHRRSRRPLVRPRRCCPSPRRGSRSRRRTSTRSCSSGCRPIRAWSRRSRGPTSRWSRSSRPSSRKCAPAWSRGRRASVADPVQRVRNLLYVAAVPDVFQIPLERYVPHVVFERLQGDVPKDDLIKILFWVATHPAGGDDSAVDNLRSAGIPVNGPGDMEQTRERVMLYALKLLGRLVGKIPS